VDVADTNLGIAQQGVLLLSGPVHDVLLYAQLGVKDSVVDVRVDVLLEKLIDRNSGIVATLHAVADVLEDDEVAVDTTAEVDDATLAVDTEGRIEVRRLGIQSIPRSDVVVEVPIAITAIPHLPVEVAVLIQVDTLLGTRDAVVVDGRVLRAQDVAVLVEQDIAVVVLQIRRTEVGLDILCQGAQEAVLVQADAHPVDVVGGENVPQLVADTELENLDLLERVVVQLLDGTLGVEQDLVPLLVIDQGVVAHVHELEVGYDILQGDVLVAAIIGLISIVGEV